MQIRDIKVCGERFLYSIVLASLLLTLWHPYSIQAAPPVPPDAPTPRLPSMTEPLADLPDSPANPPTPALGSQEIEKERAKSSMLAVLQKYLESLGPRIEAELADLTLEGDWAVGSIQWKGETQPDANLDQILARRQPDGTWTAMLPDGTEEFRQMVDEAPDDIYTLREKDELITRTNRTETITLSSKIIELIEILPLFNAQEGGANYQLETVERNTAPTPTPMPSKQTGFKGFIQSDQISSLYPTPTPHSFNNNNGKPQTLLSATSFASNSELLTPLLNWTFQGKRSRTITVDGTDQNLEGDEYISNIKHGKPSPEIVDYYSYDAMVARGWEFWGDEIFPLGVSDLYYQAPNRFLLVQYVGHQNESESEQTQLPSGDGYSVLIWLNSGEQTAFSIDRPDLTESKAENYQREGEFSALSTNPLAVPYFSQNGIWKNDRQGWPENSCTNSTLGKYGCWTTSFSMIYNYFQPNFTDPRVLNDKLNTGPNNGPKYGSCSDSDPCNACMPVGAPYAPSGVTRDSRYTNNCSTKNCIDSSNISIIENELNAGRPLAAYVHYSGTNPQHMVVITGKSDNSYYINDPWNNNKQYTLANGALSSNGYVVDYIYVWSGNPSSGESCAAPGLSSPNNDYVSPGNTLTFAWNQTSCSGQNGYLLRVGTSAGGSDVLSDYGVQGLQTNYSFGSQWYNRDLYWSVRANANGAAWSGSRRFRIEQSNPTCNPNSDQVAVYASTGYSNSGQCVIKGVGSYPNPSSIGLPNDSISSIRVGSNVKATLCRDDNYSGGCEEFLNDDIDLHDNSINIGTSSMKVEARMQMPGVPNLTSPPDFETFSEGSSIVLSWSSTGGDQFEGEFWGGPGGTLSFGPQSETSINIGSQWAGYEYEWHVRAKNGSGTSDWGGPRRFTVKPGAPTNLSATTASCSQINLTWSDNSGSEAGYKIYRNSAYLTSVDTNVTSYQDTGLSGDSSYTYYVKAYRGSIESNGSSPVSRTTSTCVSIPAPPALQSPADGATFEEGQPISLSWSSTGIQYSGEVWGGPGGTLTFGPQAGTTKNLGSQWAGYTYSWHVNAQNSAGASGRSSPRTFTVLPAEPTDLTAQSAACDQVNLSWTDHSGNEEGYKIYRNVTYLASVGPNQSYYTDSGLSGNVSYWYSVRAYRGSIESHLSDAVQVTTQSCAPPDYEAPVVDWDLPVQNEGSYDVVNEQLLLAVTASDNVGVDRVHFSRWDAVNLVMVDLGDSYTSPYSLILDCSQLNVGWNEIDITAYDAAGNASDVKYIWLYRTQPMPDLLPVAPSDSPEAVIPSSAAGTQAVDDLYTGRVTYFDWHFGNRGWGTASETFFVELWLDETRFTQYPFSNFEKDQISGFYDWSEGVTTPGWHLVRLVVDPDNRIDETDETNNVWEQWFYWNPSAPYTEDMETYAPWWTGTGLWHLVTSYSSYPNSASGESSWWYGQEETGSYDTGEPNSGDLTSPTFYIPNGEHYYLRFKYWYETESRSKSWDQRWFDISVDGDPFVHLFQLYDDNMKFWHNSPVLDLGGFGGHTIQARFQFDTGDETQNQWRGWYIDDFSLSTAAPPVCADTHEPNNELENATLVAYGQTLTGDLCANGDYDYYRVEAQAGDRMVFDLDAAVNESPLDSSITLLNNNGDILAFNDDDGMSFDSKLGYEASAAGTYYLRIREYSHPSEGGPEYRYSLRVFTDAEIPTDTEITSPAGDAWINPTQETIRASASDSGSGLQRVEFLWHSADWENSDWVWLGSDESAADGWTFDFDTSTLDEQLGGAFFVWAFDFAGNYSSAGAWNLGIDRTSPVTTLEARSMYADAPFRDFHLSWYGQDNISGITSYDIQVRDGEGAWEDFLTSTTDTYAQYLGADRHTYYFRSRARDAAGNVSEYTGEEGQAHITLYLCAVGDDQFEEDNAPASARILEAGREPQPHNFHGFSDEDWVKFTVQENKIYSIATANTGGYADTILTIYAEDGTTEILSNDDYPGLNYASLIDWRPPASGTYYAKINHWDPYGYGCTTTYDLSLLDISPALTSLTPEFTIAGGSGTTLMVHGTHFTPDTVVRWSGADMATTFVSETELTAVLPASLIASPGTVDVTVFNPDFDGVISNAVPFVVKAPLTSLEPASMVMGSSGFPLTVTGKDFVEGAVVRWNGSALETERISSTQLRAFVDASRLAIPGEVEITVFNPAPNQGETAALKFAIDYPIPELSALDPAQTTAGTPDFLMTLTGGNFVPASVIRWNGDEISTNWISATQLTATISASRIATGGTALVSVFNPAPGGGSSPAIALTINNPAPTLTGLSPQTIPASSPRFTLTVTGTNFVFGSVIRWGGADLPTTFMSRTKLAAQIDAELVTAPGVVDVTVFNPGPGGGETDPVTFSISKAIPVITTLSPASVQMGSDGFLLTVAGRFFDENTRIYWNEIELDTTVVNSSELTATIDASLVQKASVVNITVANPEPDHRVSAPVKFYVLETRDYYYIPIVVR